MMMDPIAQTLQCAIELLSKRKRFTQGTAGRTADGRRVTAGHPDAIAWCTAGALSKCAGPDTELFVETCDAVRVIIREETAYYTITDMNDQGRPFFARRRMLRILKTALARRLSLKS